MVTHYVIVIKLQCRYRRATCMSGENTCQALLVVCNLLCRWCGGRTLVTSTHWTKASGCKVPLSWKQWEIHHCATSRSRLNHHKSACSSYIITHTSAPG